MRAQLLAAGLVAILFVDSLFAQQATVPPPSTGSATLPPISAGAGSAAATPAARPAQAPSSFNPRGTAEAAKSATLSAGNTASTEPRGPITRVTKGTAALPNDRGQVWREYDLTPYTSRINDNAGVAKPEQAIIDWILRDTGTELWFTQPLGLLNADRQTLRVYHTADVQQTVNNVVDRFIAHGAEPQVFNLKLISMNNPNWRVKAQRMLKPVKVQTPGVEAWLLSKEDAALLLTEARKRTDYREQTSPVITVFNGQTANISLVRQQSYSRSVRLREGTWPETESAEIPEGCTIEFSPLLSVDKRSLDGVLKCQVDQIERMVPLALDMPTPTMPSQRLQIQVPQKSGWSLHERFRWPSDQILLVSVGIVPTPSPDKRSALGITNPFDLSSPRAEAMVALEYKGSSNQALVEQPREAQSPATRARY